MKDIDILEEKEKEAIKDLEEYLHWEELQGFSMLPRDKHIETLLNLVSNLIAENKEMKEEIERQGVARAIEEDYIEKNFINKNEIKEEIQELKNMKIDGEVFKTAVNYAIKILQSLLGKE